MAGASGAVAAAERDWHDVISHFETRGAVSAGKAIILPSDHGLSPRVLANLRRDGDLHETGNGMLWLDVAQAVNRRQQGNRVTGRLLILIALTITAAILLYLR